MTVRRSLVARVLAVGCGIVSVVQAYAAPPVWADPLTGRVQAIHASGTVRIGFREHAVPFSYAGPDGKPVGYSIDLCTEIVATLAEDLGRELAMRFEPITPENRIEKVASGAIDLECGATTNTVERRQQVAFSPVIFVTGARLAVPRGSPIRDVGDLEGRRIALVAGTTAEATMREFDRLRGLRLSVVPAPGYSEALALVAEGKADALAADEVLLRGVLAETRRSADFRFVGPMLSLEPYGIAYPRDDPALADAVSRTIARLAQSREILWIYDRWFVRSLPSGRRMDMPMSPQLRRALELLGLPPD